MEKMNRVDKAWKILEDCDFRLDKPESELAKAWRKSQEIDASKTSRQIEPFKSSEAHKDAHQPELDEEAAGLWESTNEAHLKMIEYCEDEKISELTSEGYYIVNFEKFLEAHPNLEIKLINYTGFCSCCIEDRQIRSERDFSFGNPGNGALQSDEKMNASAKSAVENCIDSDCHDFDIFWHEDCGAATLATITALKANGIDFWSLTKQMRISLVRRNAIRYAVRYKDAIIQALQKAMDDRLIHSTEPLSKEEEMRIRNFKLNVRVLKAGMTDDHVHPAVGAIMKSHPKGKVNLRYQRLNLNELFKTLSLRFFHLSSIDIDEELDWTMLAKAISDGGHGLAKFNEKRKYMFLLPVVSDEEFEYAQTMASKLKFALSERKDIGIYILDKRSISKPKTELNSINERESFASVVIALQER
jgi:hypothetical protein